MSDNFGAANLIWFKPKTLRLVKLFQMQGAMSILFLKSLCLINTFDFESFRNYIFYFLFP